MRAARSAHGFLRVLVLSSFVFLTCSSTCSGGRGGSSSPRPAPTRSRRSHQSAHLHHRPLTDEQKADQNLQFMLSLYQSAAEPDGRPKQHRKFGSNTVRLLRPSASSVRYLPASGAHHYSFTVQYSIDTLPSEQLIRASFIHLRSSSPPSSSSSSSASVAPALAPPRCRAQITSLGRDSLVTLEPHERWTETDITAHVRRGARRGSGRRLILNAQYWCSEGGGGEEERGLPRWLTLLRGGEGWGGAPRLGVPCLLLYLEEEREVTDWMGDLLGAEGAGVMRQMAPWRPSVRRRRSSEPSDPEPDGPPLDVLRDAPSSPPSSPPPPSAAPVSDLPGYKHRAGAPRNRCKLHSFRLSFNELGWGHYFIAPPVYNPRFCRGSCPRVLHYGYHSPNHAIIQTVINDLGVGDVPTPSCVPYRYMPMSVLVVHKKRVEYRELEDMVAESCTCR
ncbi:bone morphogenetic protein 15 [Brachionichthys hirsutus]|uniref:bone morphogenetic protein 15 n=1 Tax=Brachionichthys hirsutus TaxID=412623 RepID=UPI0036053176